MAQGSFGQIRAFNDFTSAMGDIAWVAGQVNLGGGVGMVSVQEGTINEVADESGGVLGFTTDTADADNVCLMAGKFDPSKGSVVIEARFKTDDITKGAIYVGFTETLVLATPVMPAEFATATMTYNGSGGMVGLVWDSDATTNAWKAVCGDGGAVSGSANYGANGTDAAEAAVNDEFDLVRVNLYPSGFAEVWHEEELVASGQTGLTATDLVYAILMCENRNTDTSAQILEVDYFYASGVRDWTV